MPSGPVPSGAMPGGAMPRGEMPSGAGERGDAGARQEGHEGAEFADTLRVPLGSAYGPRRKALRTEEEAGGATSRSSEGASPGERSWGESRDMGRDCAAKSRGSWLGPRQGSRSLPTTWLPSCPPPVRSQGPTC